MPPVLREHDRWSAISHPCEQRLKERRVLVSVHDLNSVLAEKRRQSERAFPVDARLTVEDSHRHTARGELFTQHPDFVVQAGKNKSVTVRQFPRETRCEDFGASDVQAVQNLANDRPIIACWRYCLNHDAPPAVMTTGSGDGVCTAGSFKY